ncbi:MAG: TOBE domain-containing protein, partial [bacterium]
PGPTVTVDGEVLFRLDVRPLFVRSQARPVVLGVRPEAVRVSPAAASESAAGLFSGRIEVVERLGAETFLEVDTGHHQLTARVNGDLRWEMGQRVGLRLDPASVRLFDPETKEAIPLIDGPDVPAPPAPA